MINNTLNCIKENILYDMYLNCDEKNPTWCLINTVKQREYVLHHSGDIETLYKDIGPPIYIFFPGKF